MTLKIRFYLIKKKKPTIMHNIYIYIYTHKNSQLLRWYAMILIYSKSDILRQLHFLWSLNSNLQINRLGAAYKMPICLSKSLKFWYSLFFIIISKTRSYLLVQLNISAIMGALKFLKKREWYQKFVNFPANISTHPSWECLTW